MWLKYALKAQKAPEAARPESQKAPEAARPEDPKAPEAARPEPTVTDRRELKIAGRRVKQR